MKRSYTLLGDKEYRKFLDAEFKSEKSNFHISINVDMWITGFDVPCLTMLYNDKPLSKHTLIQTISRVNRRYGTKEFGFIIDYIGIREEMKKADYIGIREEMKKAMKKYGGEVGPQEDLDTAHEILKNELQLLQERLSGLSFKRFFGDNDLARLQFIQEAAEYILANSVERKGEVSFLAAPVHSGGGRIYPCQQRGTERRNVIPQTFQGTCQKTPLGLQHLQSGWNPD